MSDLTENQVIAGTVAIGLALGTLFMLWTVIILSETSHRAPITIKHSVEYKQ